MKDDLTHYKNQHRLNMLAAEIKMTITITSDGAKSPLFFVDCKAKKPRIWEVHDGKTIEQAFWKLAQSPIIQSELKKRNLN